MKQHRPTDQDKEQANDALTKERSQRHRRCGDAQTTWRCCWCRGEKAKLFDDKSSAPCEATGIERRRIFIVNHIRFSNHGREIHAFQQLATNFMVEKFQLNQAFKLQIVHTFPNFPKMLIRIKTSLTPLMSKSSYPLRDDDKAGRLRDRSSNVVVLVRTAELLSKTYLRLVTTLRDERANVVIGGGGGGGR
uniref:Uncharacterized protein n=1 Tax=Romanomermis culicivorax TaxID=13658 RepID=A0A915KXW7_ROMCU